MRNLKPRFSIRALLILVALAALGIVAWPSVWMQWSVYSVTRNIDRKGGDFVRPAADALAEGGEESVPVFLRLLEHEDLYVRIVAAEKLGEIGPDERSVEALVAALSDDNFRVRMTAANMLCKMEELAEPAIPELVTCLSDENSEVQVFAIQSLGRLADNGVNTVAAVPALSNLCKESVLSTVARGALEKMAQSQIAELSSVASGAVAEQ